MLIGFGLVTLASCNQDEMGEDGLGKADVNDELAGREDPIAQWLRDGSGMAADGRLQGDYRKIVEGVAGKLQCDPATINTFVLSDAMVTGAPFPRLISTACTNNDDLAWQFFMSAPFATKDGSDVDPRKLEMFAWDGTSEEYRFYAAEPVGDSATEVQIEVDPKDQTDEGRQFRCQGCHFGPSLELFGQDHMRMLPIMNELTNPWGHWNARPGFPSDSTFTIPSNVARADSYADLTNHNVPCGCKTEDDMVCGGNSTAFCMQSAITATTSAKRWRRCVRCSATSRSTMSASAAKTRRQKS
jgi:hypothetical protein